MKRRIFSIATGAPFLSVLCARLLAGEILPGFDGALAPHLFANLTLYLPTRRAARAFSQILLEQIAQHYNRPAMLMPKILPLGALEGAGDDDFTRAPILPVLSEPARQIALTNLILKFGAQMQEALVAEGADNASWRGEETASFATTRVPAQALALAHNLCQLMDEMTREGIAFDDLQKLDHAGHDRYFEITLRFLQIATDYWPHQLAEWGMIEKTTAQVGHIEAEIKRLEWAQREKNADAPPHWTLAAGSTGSNFITARLLAAISTAPHGAIVLPGLDHDLDEPAFASILQPEGDYANALPHASHPQFTLAKLLKLLAVSRLDIPAFDDAPAPTKLRRNFLSIAMRPANLTDAWHEWQSDQRLDALLPGLADVAIIKARDEEEEALALATAMRAVLAEEATPHQTCALITPDRTLALRVRLALARWGIMVEDSAGTPLADSLAGTHIRLILAYAQSFSNTDAVALLNHPASTFAYPRSVIAKLAQQLEFMLRDQQVALTPHFVVNLAAETELEPAQPELAALLSVMLDTVADFAKPHRQSLADWLLALQAVVDVIASLPSAQDTPAPALSYARNELPELRQYFQLKDAPASAAIMLNLAEFAHFTDRFMAALLIPQRGQSHPRLKILGLLEARLLSCDVALLGGLNETVWPIQPQSDMFLSRPMREALGLPLPERRIGQSAHDFVALMGNPKIILSHAQKRDGTPQGASRFLQRMKACAGDTAYSAMETRGAFYLTLARALDDPAHTQRGAVPAKISRPEPRPALTLRPRTLSVTRIETLRRDPYALYADKILRLKPLGALDVSFDARLKGIVWHEFFEACANHIIVPQLANPVANFAPILRKKAYDKALDLFSAALDDDKFAFVLWHRFEIALDFYCRYELSLLAQSPRLVHLQTESMGAIHLALDKGAVIAGALDEAASARNTQIFTLTAKPDRLEQFDDGSINIVDFKTGTLPTAKEIKAGFAPQLTLELAMLAHGAFGVPPAPNATHTATYIKIGSKSGGDIFPIKEADTLATTHLENCIALLRRYHDAATPYRARPFVDFALRYNAFDHLARTKEWSQTGGQTADSSSAGEEADDDATEALS